MVCILRAREAFLDALLDTGRVAAQRVLESACQEAGPAAALDALMMPALESVGARWESGELALSQVHMSGRICEEIMEALLPFQDGSGGDGVPQVAIGVLEDYRALGKRIVLSVLRASGIRVLLVSALMLRSALRIKDLVGALGKARLAVKVVAGGVPFVCDRRLGDEVGADAAGYSASDAVAIVRRLLGGER